MIHDFALQWVDPEGRKVIIEDDGRTGYAYLVLPCDLIRSHVWLYNRENVVTASDQTAPINSEDSIGTKDFPDPIPDDFDIAFSLTTRQAAIYVKGELLAILSEYSPVGLSRLSLRPNNVARPMESDGVEPRLVSERRDRKLLTWGSDDFTTLIETDPRATYAYLYQGEQRVSSVWLWNSPEPNPEYLDRPDETGNRMPNEFAEAGFEVPNEEDIMVMNATGTDISLVYVRKRLHAILDPRFPVGKCIAATSDSPLALRMA